MPGPKRNPMPRPKQERPRYRWLVALIWLLVALAVITTLPFSASKTNDLGYYSLCSFVPWSTMTFLVPAGVLWAIRSYLLTRAT